MSTRFLVFDDPPSVQYCLAIHEQRVKYIPALPQEDYTFSVPLASLKHPPAPRRPTPSPPPQASLLHQDTTRLDVSYAPLGASYQQQHSINWGDDEDASGATGESTRREDGTENMDCDDTRLHGFHFAPTQNRTALSQLLSQRHTQLQSRTMDIGSQPTFYDSQCASNQSVGVPPHFPWQPYDLTRFDELRAVLKQPKRSKRQPRISVLAVVVDIHPMREVGANKHVAEWDLMDPSGQSIKFSIWGSGGDEVSSAVRREDVVWIGDARLSEYQERPRLAADHVFGRQIDDEGWGLQVCWRIKAVDEEDFVHRFHEDLRDQGFACVDEVLKVVDWYRQRWRS